MIGRAVKEQIIKLITEGLNSTELDDTFTNASNLFSISQFIAEKFETQLNPSISKEFESEKGDIAKFNRQLAEANRAIVEFGNLKLQKESLEQEFEEKSKISAELLRLKSIKETVESIDIEAVQDEIQKIEGDNEANFRNFYGLIDSIVEQLKRINSIVEGNDAVGILKENHEKLKEDIDSSLKLLTDDLVVLESLVKSKSEELGQQKIAYNLCLEKLKHIRAELKLVGEVHDKNLTIWKTHFEANEKIWGDLSNSGIHLANHVKELSGKIEKELKQYDIILKGLIQANDKKSFYELP